jgi:DNA-binding transcriptional LysR family regulator
MNTSLLVDSENNRTEKRGDERCANRGSVLVVGTDSTAVAATAQAIDPLRTFAVAVNHLEAADRIRKGGIDIVVLLRRHMDPTGLLIAIRSFDPSVVLIAASNSLSKSLSEFDGITVRFAESVTEIESLVQLSSATHPSR